MISSIFPFLKIGFPTKAAVFTSLFLVFVQGQESIAMSRLATARKEGGWVLLQNIHLTIDWTSGPLEKLIDKLSEDTHEDFRCEVFC